MSSLSCHAKTTDDNIELTADNDESTMKPGVQMSTISVKCVAKNQYIFRKIICRLVF